MVAYKIFEKSISSLDVLFCGYVANREGEAAAQTKKVAN